MLVLFHVTFISIEVCQSINFIFSKSTIMMMHSEVDVFSMQNSSMLFWIKMDFSNHCENDFLKKTSGLSKIAPQGSTIILLHDLYKGSKCGFTCIRHIKNHALMFNELGNSLLFYHETQQASSFPQENWKCFTNDHTGEQIPPFPHCINRFFEGKINATLHNATLATLHNLF